MSKEKYTSVADMEPVFVPEEKIIQHTPIFNLVEKQDNGIIGFNPVGINSNDWITIAVEMDGKFLMEKQLRYGKMKYYNEFPSGIVEYHENPIYAAVRELSEETGYCVAAGYIDYLGKFDANPAFMSNYMHYFYVNLDRVPFEVKEPQPDQFEKIEIYWEEKEKVLEKYFKDHDSVFKAGMFLLLKKNGLI